MLKMDNGLLKSDPLQPFGSDCCHCIHFLNQKFTDIGICGKRDVACGWGFTCNDFKNMGGVENG